MSIEREVWFALVQQANGEEETEVVTIERENGGAPVIELTDGRCIQAIRPAIDTTEV